MEQKNELSELARVIETNKHDVTMRVRSIVLDPIKRMNRSGAATDLYFREVGEKNEEISRTAKEIMSFFEKKWSDPKEECVEKKIQSMRQNMAHVVSVIIPQIKQVVAFYTVCASKKYFFSSNNEGEKALTKMTKAKVNCERVCESLLRLEGDYSKEKSEFIHYNLLEILQEGLDSIDAHVIYSDEYMMSNIIVYIIPDIFLNHVLINIKENINTHAFGTLNYRQKYVWEKKVFVEIKDEGSTITILIHNNGEPFTGNISKVFEYGYCYGEMKHSGIGMHSIRKGMKELGGDVDFIKSNNPQYTTTYKLLLKK